ncbi:MAG: hypothetical protein HW416_2635, partial [Chloroflexi bacterium]|nr:hypothetical protein [Chloroflexota bacterium]
MPFINPTCCATEILLRINLLRIKMKARRGCPRRAFKGRASIRSRNRLLGSLRWLVRPRKRLVDHPTDSIAHLLRAGLLSGLDDSVGQSIRLHAALLSHLSKSLAALQLGAQVVSIHAKYLSRGAENHRATHWAWALEAHRATHWAWASKARRASAAVRATLPAIAHRATAAVWAMLPTVAHALAKLPHALLHLRTELLARLLQRVAERILSNTKVQCQLLNELLSKWSTANDGRALWPRAAITLRPDDPHTECE